MALTWRTETRIENPRAQIIETAGFINRHATGATIPAVSRSVNIGGGRTVFHHSLVFENLKQNTLYTYRVGDDTGWGEWNRFRTAGTASDPFVFLFIGDIQTQIEPMGSQALRAAFQTASDARLWIFAGDLVNEGRDDSHWQELFNAVGWISKIVPFAPAAGNHEYPDPRVTPENARTLTPLWFSHFNLPANGPEQLTQSCYTFTFQGVRFIVLNGNEKLDLQAAWMTRILENNRQPRIIAAIHQPMYSVLSGRREKIQHKEILVPVFDRFGVDLVLQGHGHAYSRTFALKNHARTAPGEKGTVYLMSVTGPKAYPADIENRQLFAKITTGRQWFQKIEVRPDKIVVSTLNLSGSIDDRFEIPAATGNQGIESTFQKIVE